MIAIEQQAHGHTAAIDRPITYVQMADDTVELLRQLKIENADFLGYSMGGGVAFELPWQKAYAGIAPEPANWSALVFKIRDLVTHVVGWNPAEVRAIQAPALLIVGDSDIVRPEHVVEMFRLLSGGVPGDVNGLPRSQLAVLPGTPHVSVIERAGGLLSMVTAFLDAPPPKANCTAYGNRLRSKLSFCRWVASDNRS